MSGSSMDGVDLAHCTIKYENVSWDFKINHGTTIPFNENWRVRLSQLRKQSALNYVKTDVFRKELHMDYIGKSIEDKFIVGYGLDYDGLGRNLPDIYQLNEGL